jgi:hypothetical protein
MEEDAGIKQSAVDELDENIAWLDNMITNNEKRRHPRRKVGLKGGLCLRKPTVGEKEEFGGGEIPAGVLEMSASGAGILTAKEMNKGQRFRVVCPLKKGRLSLTLKVVRFSKIDRAFRYGCEMSLCEKSA